MKQTRYVSSNSKKKFNTSEDFFRYMAGQLVCCCDCDGRGCVICIAADALEEAAKLAELRDSRNDTCAL